MIEFHWTSKPFVSESTFYILKLQYTFITLGIVINLLVWDTDVKFCCVSALYNKIIEIQENQLLWSKVRHQQRGRRFTRFWTDTNKGHFAFSYLVCTATPRTVLLLLVNRHENRGSNGLRDLPKFTQLSSKLNYNRNLSVWKSMFLLLCTRSLISEWGFDLDQVFSSLYPWTPQSFKTSLTNDVQQKTSHCLFRSGMCCLNLIWFCKWYVSVLPLDIF